ncbi:hypothetical protein OC25_16160 [Pedobacter kyungheensis]|uniref:Uncharacterized protein n=1 Tax=Pedobacter kyungheensis TaxID=1069985 RepID=A0A0C1FL64_9SPHI|nr:hypothetical protein OC25_16160 [Pedobacter kyungheensis]
MCPDVVESRVEVRPVYYTFIFALPGVGKIFSIKKYLDLTQNRPGIALFLIFYSIPIPGKVLFILYLLVDFVLRRKKIIKFAF